MDAVERAVGLTTGLIPEPPKEHPLPKYRLIQTGSGAFTAMQEIRAYLDSAGGKVSLALDIETGGKTKPDGLRYLDGELLLVSVATPEYAWVFDAASLSGSVDGMFGRMLQNPDICWVLHNAKFDIQWLRHRYGAYPFQWVDTMCYALALTERGEGVGLKTLSRRYLNAGFYEDTLQVPKNASYSVIPRPVLAEYAAYDVIYTIRLLPVLERLVAKEGTEKLVPFLMAAQKAFADCEYYGTRFDVAWANHLSALWAPKIEEMAARLKDYARAHGYDARNAVAGLRKKSDALVKKGKPIPPELIELTPSSPTQLAHLCFDVIGLRPPGGKRTTSQDLLDAYPDHEVVKLLSDLRHYEHMQRTYIDGFLDDVWSDGRVHPDILVLGTVTGRLSIHNPPLQIIPKNNVDPEIATMLHRLFVASDGHTFANVDYKQLEIRVAWLLSGDENLGRSVLTGDFHRMTASRVFGKSPEDVTDFERFSMKAMSFGLMYGRGAKALSDGELSPLTKGDVRIAQEYIKEFFQMYSRYSLFYQRAQEEAIDNGFLSTPFGRKRRWNLISPDTVGSIRTQSVNFPVQSVASDICLSSLIRLNQLFNANGWGHVLFTVHDAIVFEIANEHLDEALRLIHAEMTRTDLLPCALPENFRLDVDVEIGPNWGETKGWKP
jgi:DNA polymerase I-like protein with 3'-5' exonuclease and polymerase domains